MRPVGLLVYITVSISGLALILAVGLHLDRRKRKQAAQRREQVVNVRLMEREIRRYCRTGAIFLSILLTVAISVWGCSLMPVVRIQRAGLVADRPQVLCGAAPGKAAEPGCRRAWPDLRRW